MGSEKKKKMSKRPAYHPLKKFVLFTIFQKFLHEMGDKNATVIPIILPWNFGCELSHPKVRLGDFSLVNGLVLQAQIIRQCRDNGAFKPSQGVENSDRGPAMRRKGGENEDRENCCQSSRGYLFLRVVFSGSTARFWLSDSSPSLSSSMSDKLPSSSLSLVSSVEFDSGFWVAASSGYFFLTREPG